MGRKSTAVLQGIVDRILEMDRQNITKVKIAEILQSEGYNISREAVRMVVKNSAEAAKEYKLAYQEAQAIVDIVRNNPGTDTLEAITAVISSKLLAEVKNIDGMSFETPESLANVVRSLTGSQVRIAKLRLEHSKGYEAAKKDFISRLSEELKDNHPQLLKQLVETIKNMSAKNE